MKLNFVCDNKKRNIPGISQVSLPMTLLLSRLCFWVPRVELPAVTRSYNGIVGTDSVIPII